jgi:hypothetical protein
VVLAPESPRALGSLGVNSAKEPWLSELAEAREALTEAFPGTSFTASREEPLGL